jgi:hypothetical protein
MLMIIITEGGLIDAIDIEYWALVGVEEVALK